jgi:carbonic anhydrase/acetyltransferase-like protein (isoleucine patch superfamily)
MPIYSLDDVSPQLPADGDFWIAPDAVLIGKVRLEKGASIWFGAVLRGDNDWITIGEGSNVQDHSVIHADPGQPVRLGRGVTIGHRVIVHSASVGDNSLIGMGAVLLNRAQVGVNCLVGAGALVTEDKHFADDTLILGAPANAVRKLSQDENAGLARSAQGYVVNSRRYAAGLDLKG